MIPQVSKFIINMEGVLWHGDTPMTGLTEFLNLLVYSESIDFVLETNNASRSKQSYIEQVARFGVTLSPDHLFTAGAVTAKYLQSKYPPKTPIYLIGETGMAQLLKEAGFQVLSEKEARYATAEAVVVGLDREVTYQKMATAATHIKQGADFIATNPDTNLPADGSCGRVPARLSPLFKRRVAFRPKLSANRTSSIFQRRCTSSTVSRMRRSWWGTP